MKALTLWRPWPWAIFHAPEPVRKTIENRPWKPWKSILGERIALHAGRHYDDDAAEEILEKCGISFGAGRPPNFEDEGIIGTVRIMRYFTSDFDIIPAQRQWWSGPFAWALGDVQALPEPIPCKGKQGLWDLPAEIASLLPGAPR